MLKRLSIFVVVVAGIAAGAGLLVRQFPSLFSIREVEVRTEWPLSEERVRAWLPGLIGRNLWGTDGLQLVDDLQKQSWVSEASIKKEFPDRIRIEVKPRIPKAFWSNRGEIWIVDETGKKLERVTPHSIKDLDLPVVSLETDSVESQWASADAVALTQDFQSAIHSGFRISELVLSDYPYFKVYLADYRLELLYSLDTWQDQIAVTRDLLLHPPSQIGQPRRINLVFPKKAVVSPTLSQ
jgi:hypothetical protein